MCSVRFVQGHQSRTQDEGNKQRKEEASVISEAFFLSIIAACMMKIAMYPAQIACPFRNPSSGSK